jgi:transposase InsO family protein
VIQSKSAEEIINAINEWIDKEAEIKELITDNSKEFCNVEFRKLCSENNIMHTTVGVESHRSNGRVERVIRTLKDLMIKDKGETLEGKVERATQIYNSTYHSSIKCTPIEAWKDESGIVNFENSAFGRYATKFKKRYSEKFKIEDEVKIAKNENLQDKTKELKGRFIETGIILYKRRETCI